MTSGREFLHLNVWLNATFYFGPGGGNFRATTSDWKS
jgi:hypothetical protein